MRLLFAIALVVLALLFAAFLLLVRPAWSATRCTTDEEQAPGRLQTPCDKDTRAVSPDTPILDRWELMMRPPRPSGLRDQRRPEPKAPRR
jgi:hypothetical protein